MSAFRAIAAMVAMAAAVMLIAVAAVPADGATGGLPRSPTALNTTSGLAVRPHRILYTGDGTGILGGRQIGQRAGLTWSSWTATSALGTGYDLENNCQPSCAGGTYLAYPVTLEMWRPRTISDALVFTRLTLLYPGRVAPGTPAAGSPPHYTFTDVHSPGRDGGGFGWGPPAAQDYCVNRHGEAPFPGCQNITALPPAGLFADVLSRSAR